MKKDPVAYHNVGLPIFGNISPLEPQVLDKPYTPLKQTDRGCQAYDDHPLTLFDLSSHKRARDAIEFGLKMRNKGFHVFVVGEDRSGRMTSTMSYLKQYVKEMPTPNDWIYVNNFMHSHKPLPYALPAGKGTYFQEKLDELIHNIISLLNKTFNNPHFLRQIDTLTASVQQQIDQQIHDIQNYAHEKGYGVTQTADGFSIDLLNGDEQADESDAMNSQEMQGIRDRINKMSLSVHNANQKIQKKIHDVTQSMAKKAIQPSLQKFREEFADPMGEWIDTLKDDILKNVQEFHASGEEAEGQENAKDVSARFLERYRVNVFVDHKDAQNPRVILEANPTYENLFGAIKYQTNANGAPETNFTMIRPGSLHLANGGILVLRADAIARNPEVWETLKSALRDHVIRIEERYRDHALPLWDAPEPKPIPLNVQVFLIASPYWYYNFFFNDPEFRSYFKIKADIDADMPATESNVNTYRQLVRHNALKLTQKEIDDEAIEYLIGCSARWVGHRERLSAKFEQIADILHEATILSTNQGKITKQIIQDTLSMRRIRNAGSEDRSHDDIQSGQILIDTKNTAIGQINGLSVLSTGDYSFGLPCRISARSYAGDVGVLNIERLTELAGPIQQKGAMILEGFLNGFFAQNFPLSYTCSLTFEQSYVDVDGDSASMAEVIAILSSLSGVPVRQDIGITGSMNQFGVAQPIGGTHTKVEGFHRVCSAHGLTGTQGVIVPKSNLVNLTLREEVVEHIKQGQFFIWSVDTVFEAIELMLGMPCGVVYDETGAHSQDYPFFKFEKDSIFDRVEKNLKRYHESVMQGKHD